MTELITDEITQVTNAYQKSNYTFRLIKQSDTNGKYFLNLVVKEYKDTFYLYIVKYVPDETWLSMHSISTDLDDFTGMVYFYSDEGIYVAKATMANGSSTSVTRHPCENENNDSGGGGGGGSSGSGDDTGNTGESGSEGGTGGSGGGTGGWNIYVDCQTDNCWCEGNNVGVHDCSGIGVVTTCTITVSGNKTADTKALNDALRHPCDVVDGNVEDCYTMEGDPCPYGCDASGENCADDGENENDNVGILIDSDTPCDKLTTMTNNEEIKIRLKELIQSSNANNYEEGFGIINYNGQEGPSPIIPSQNLDCGSVKLTITPFTYAIAHSHPVNCNVSNVFGMFSGADVFTLSKMANLYNSDNDGNIANNFNELTVMLAYQNTVFALKLDNANAITELSNLFENKRIRKRFNNRLDEKYNWAVPNGQQSANIGDLMKALLKTLEEFGLEISLYQADVNNDNLVTGWSKRKLNENGTLANPEPCN